MTETLTVATAEAVKEYQPVYAIEAKVVTGYTGNRALKQGQAYRNWYARFDPVTAENLSYDKIK